MEEKNNINENKNSASNKDNLLKQIITGRIFVNTSIQKHIGYIIFIFLLAVVYIGYRYKVESTALENRTLDNDIKRLHTEYVYQSKHLMNLGKKSKIFEQIRKKNLTVKEPQNPFILIKTN
jgi:hypothetical protein